MCLRYNHNLIQFVVTLAQLVILMGCQFGKLIKKRIQNRPKIQIQMIPSTSLSEVNDENLSDDNIDRNKQK